MAFRAASSANSAAANVTSIVIPVPTGTVANDVMFTVIGNSNGTGTGAGFTIPTGWTAVTPSTAVSTTMTYGVYSKVASGSEPASYTWATGNNSTTAHLTGSCVSHYGLNTANPVNVFSSTTVTTASTGVTWPPIPSSTITAPSLVLGLAATRNTTTRTVSAAGSGNTLESSAINTASAFIQTFIVDYPEAAGGHTSPSSSTLSASATQGKTTLILNPAPTTAAYVQSASSPDNTSYLQNFQASLTPTAGNLLIATVEGGGTATAITSVTDSQSNTWTKLGSTFSTIGSSVYWTFASAGTADTVTANGDGGYYLGNVTVREYNGANATTPIASATFSNESSSTTSHSTSGTTNRANSIVLGFYAVNPNPTYTTSQSNLSQITNDPYASQATADTLVASAGSGTVSITSSAATQGTMWSIVINGPGASAPVTAPPAANNTPNWYPYGVLPTGKTVAALLTIAQNWWNNQVKPNYLVTTGMPSGQTGMYRIQRPENSNDTVSEGMGYGMIGAALMAPYDSNAHAIFDGLYKYVKYFLDSNGLMNYQINSSGSVIGTGAATDADHDIAWALDLAYQRWGGVGGYNYATERDNYLSAILAYEYYPAATSGYGNVMIDGDAFDSGFTGTPNLFDPDYFAPMYFQAWSSFNSRWSDIKAANYPIYAATDTYNTGLIPDHQKRDGSQSTTSGLTGYANTYNAVRRFRQVPDYLNYGSQLASPYEDYYQHTRLADFIANASSNTPGSMLAGYSLDGTSNLGYTNATFNQSYMVAMLLNSNHSTLAASTIDWIVAHPDGSYFGDMTSLMGLMTAAGMMTPTVSAVSAPTTPSNLFFFGT